MADTAAHLVDRVFPIVPVRQRVLSLPFALRYRMTYDAAPLTDVLNVLSARCLANYGGEPGSCWICARRNAARLPLCRGLGMTTPVTLISDLLPEVFCFRDRFQAADRPVPHPRMVRAEAVEAR
jgi:hypothetical protein